MDTVLITGGTGMVGTRLRQRMSARGIKSLVLTRDKELASSSDEHLYWNVKDGVISDDINSVTHVVNLVGSGIADGRWTDERKRSIMDSRTKTTGFLINALRKSGVHLKSFISASAIGYYGDGGDKVLYEDSGVVTDEFLSQVCAAWEGAAQEAQDISERLVILRIATVLSRQGGALAKMDATIPYGIANYLGSGRQYFSWIHIDDLCDLIIEGIVNSDYNGIYNACAPEEMTNKDFTIELRDAFNKKALLLPAPAFGIKLAFGEMSRVVLNSSRVSAQKLLDAGFQFEYRTADRALAELYGEA